jgi:hypothetical protein
MVELVGARACHRLAESVNVGQVAVHKLDSLSQMLGQAAPRGRRAPSHPRDPIAALQQQLGQKRAILAGEPRHERPAWARSALPRNGWSATGLASDRALARLR